MSYPENPGSNNYLQTYCLSINFPLSKTANDIVVLMHIIYTIGIYKRTLGIQ